MSGARFVASILAVYAAFILAIGDISWPWALLSFGKFIATALPAWVFCGLAFAAYAFAVEQRSATPRSPLRLYADLIRERWAKDRLFILVWPPLLYISVLGLFGLFKQHVLIHTPFTFDQTFHAFDVAIFGTEPWRLSHGGPELTAFLGTAYYGWYAPMMLGTLAVALCSHRPAFRDRYISAFVLTWIIVGSVMAYLLPAAGPCYWGQFVPGPNLYAELMAKIGADVAASSAYNPVLDAQAYLLAAYGGNTVLGGGISAMPSMHVAAAALFACGAWQVHRALGMLFAGFAAVIWWASVHLGWHYFVDGLVAIPATLFVWWLCGKLFPEPLLNDLHRKPSVILDNGDRGIRAGAQL